MTAPTAQPSNEPTVGPLRARLLREVRDLYLLAFGSIALWLVIWGLSDMFPFAIWWPISVVLVTTLGLVVGTPDGSTTVRHGIRSALAHPVAALVVVGLVTLPQLGGWVSAAIAAGVEHAVHGVVSAATPHVSTPDLGGLWQSLTGRWSR